MKKILLILSVILLFSGTTQAKGKNNWYCFTAHITKGDTTIPYGSCSRTKDECLDIVLTDRQHFTKNGNTYKIIENTCESQDIAYSFECFYQPNDQHEELAFPTMAFCNFSQDLISQNDKILITKQCSAVK
jgi:hypothetical protein